MNAAATTARRGARTLRWGVLRLGTGALCAIVGALMLMAPGEFASPFYATFRAAPWAWGATLFLAGFTLIAAGVLGAGAFVAGAAHMIAGGILILFGAGVARASAPGWIYAVLGAGTIAAILRRDRHTGFGGGDGLSFVMGLNLVFVGGLLTWSPPWLPATVTAPYASVYPFGPIGLAITGVVLSIAQVLPVPRPALVGIHLAAGAAHGLFHLPFLGTTVWPARAYWLGLGTLVGAAPWLGPLLDRAQPRSLRVRLSVLMALFVIVPFVGLESAFRDGWNQSGPQHVFAILLLGSAAAIATATVFATWLTRPLRRMTETMRRQVGSFAAVPAASDADEVEAVANAFDVMMHQLDAERAAREAALDAARRGRERAEQLQAATAALAVTATPEEAGSVAVDQALRGLSAAGAVVLVLADDGASLRLLAAEGFPPWLRERWRHVPINARVGVAEAARDHAAIWMRTRTERLGRYSYLAPTDVPTGYESWIFLPLLVNGRAIGSLSMAFPEVQPLDAEQRTQFLSFAAQCANALERTQSRRAEQLARQEAETARRRTERLQALTAALGRAAGSRDVMLAAEELARYAIGAKSARLYLLSDDGMTLRLGAAAPSEAQPTAPAVPSIPAGAPTAAAESSRRRAALWLESRAEIDRRYPDSRYDPPEARHEQARAALPLAAGDQRIGALVLGFAAAREFDTDDRAMLLAMAQQTAQALARTRLYEREHAISERLQRSLLPGDPPAIPGFACAVRYIPAAAPTMAVGGDWYDVFALPGGRIGIAVGDVAGHGLEAAAFMGQVRLLLRAYALEGHAPDAALDRLNRIVDPREMVTLIYVVLDPIAGAIEYANAGHCAPLVVEPGRESRFLYGNNPPIAGISANYDRYEHPAPEGATFVLYTDGLIEFDRVVDAGMARLGAAAARAARLDVEAAADAILADVLGNAPPRDDAAFVLFRLQPVDPDRLRVAVPAVPSSLRALRWSLQRWLAVAGVPADDASEIVLAAGEAATNVVEHAYGPRNGPLELIARRLDDAIEITVRDAGAWRPPCEEGRGKGLVLMRAAMDTVEVRQAPQGTLVRMKRRRRRRSEG